MAEIYCRTAGSQRSQVTDTTRIQMSDPQHTEHEENHEGPIKTPKQLVGAVVASFVIPIVVIIMLANFVNIGGKTGAGSDGMTEDAVGRRIQPVGRIEIKDAAGAGLATNIDKIGQHDDDHDRDHK